jgi:hypothetical protein
MFAVHTITRVHVPLPWKTAKTGSRISAGAGPK